MPSHAERAALSDADRAAQRVIVVHGAIDEHLADIVIGELWAHHARDRSAPVAMYLDCPGGHVGAALAIAGAIDDVKLPVHTHCLVCTDGPAALVLARGARGHRTAAPGAQLSLARCDVQGGLEEPFASALARATGKETAAIRAAIRGHASFTPDEAVGYGLIDRVED
jgi:ATP-dependent Clp protease protease subunit